MNEIVLDFLFGSGKYSQAIAPLAVAAIGQGIAGLVGAFSAGAQRREAKRAAQRQQMALSALEKSRQAVVNPYENVQDLSGTITNPYANLQVATQAAQMQAEQTDVALASTLDTLRATGTGAGGATALARAAAESKQGIAANIEQQEARNAELRAQGEQRMQQLQMGEKVRVQQAEAAGKEFVFGVTEGREVTQLDRAQSMLDQYRAQEAQAKTAQSQAIGSLVGAAASMGAQALGGTNPFTGNPVGGGGSSMSMPTTGYVNPLNNANQFMPIGSFSQQIPSYSQQLSGQRFVPSIQLGG